MFLSLVDLGFQPRSPNDPVLDVRTTCTNRNLPADLKQQVGDRLEFEVKGAVPARVRCLCSPTAPFRFPLQRSAQWRLISHLSLNHLSLADGDQGAAALRRS